MTHPVTDRGVQDSDLVKVEFSLKVFAPDGSEESGTEKPQTTTLEMQYVPYPELKSALLGKNIHDSFEVEVNVPETESEEKHPMAGKRLEYKMKVLEIMWVELPEMTPEFFKKIIPEDIETEEVFRERIAELLIKNLEENEQRAVEQRAMNLLAEKSDIEVPPSLIGREMRRIRHQEERDAQERYGISFDKLLEMRNIVKGDYDQELTARAWITTRNSLVMNEFSKSREIKVETEDADNWLKRESERQGVDMRTLAQAYLKSQEGTQYLFEQVQFSKALDALLGEIKIKDVDKLSEPVNESEPVTEPEAAEQNLPATE